MKKALLVTTVSGFIPQFEMNNVTILQEMGFEVHYAANYHTPALGTDNHRLDGTGIVRHQIDFARSPYSSQNLQAYRQLKKVMEKNQFSLVHCHTPMGSVLTRLASHATKTGPVIYTAHGFHFFRGAPWRNWLFYYPVEKRLSCHTYQLITINKEDYQRAQGFSAKYVDYTPGCGIDPAKIRKMTAEEIRKKKKELRIPENKTVLLSVGELIYRKNHESVIHALAELNDPSIVYVICGHGVLDKKLENLVAKLNLQEQVIFAGYREDVMGIYPLADLFVFPSWQEGLPMALLESMANGLPVVCSKIRGNVDLMGPCETKNKGMGWSLHSGGAMVERADDVQAYADSIRWCLNQRTWREACGARNRREIENFSLEKVERIMRKIYQRACNRGIRGEK